MYLIAVADFPNVHLDRGCLGGVVANVDGPDEKATEQVVERIEAGQIAHTVLLKVG